MKGVFIADLKMLPCSGRIDAQRLMSRQADLLRDLYCLVPRLASLCFGTLDVSWVLGHDACWLRLQLVPRQRPLFDLVIARSTPKSLPDEARLVWADICDSHLRALQAASGLEKWSKSETPTVLDPLLDMAFRRSREQWTFEVESGQLCLEFPEVPRYLIDEAPSEVHGIVDAVFSRALILRQVRIGPSDVASAGISLQGPLRIAPDRNDMPPNWGSPCQPRLQVWPGRNISLPATLCRCLLSRQIIGAVAQERDLRGGTGRFA
jgi:hypothetical protein